MIPPLFLTNQINEEFMRVKMLVVICCLFFYNQLFAQKDAGNYKLTGFTVDSASGKALEGVNILILARANNENIGGSSSDKKGSFTVNKILQKNVRIKFSMTGYQTKIIDSLSLETSSRIGIVKLKATVYELPEFVIKTVKPMVEFHVDKQVVNMDQVPGGSSTITEALKSTGLVEVDPQSNNITIRGESVKIQMDGHPYEMSSDMLAQMPTAMADQVELILAPSAKESAEGGTYILNIISKKSILDSYSGSISLNTSNSNRNYGGLNLNYKRDKLNIFATIFGGQMEFKGDNYNDRYNYNSTTFYNQRSDGENETKYKGASPKIGFDYNFDDKNSMTAYVAYFGYKTNSTSSDLTAIRNQQMNNLYTYDNSTSGESTMDYTSAYSFYKTKFDNKGHELTFDLLYNNINSSGNSDRNLAYSNSSYLQSHKSDTKEKANTVIFKTDYVHPSDIGKFETGYNFTYRDRENNYNNLDYMNTTAIWEDSSKLSNYFKYNENINALYLTYSKNLGFFDLKTGIRAENLNTHGEQITSDESFSNNYFNLFPNFNLSHKFNDMFQLAFNAFRRVQYPTMGYLNPFKKYNGPNSYTAGNPKIDPQFIQSYGINLSQFINTYYVYSTGNISYATAVIEDSVTYSSPININSSKLFGVDLTLPYYNSPLSPVHLPGFITMFNIRYSYNYREQTGHYLTENLTYTSRNHSINCNLTLKVWYDVNLSFYFRYRPKTEDAKGTSSEIKDMSLYLNKSFFDQKLKVNLSFSDLLNSQVYKGDTFGTTYRTNYSYTPYKSQSVSLGITYMFNDYKERRDRDIDDGRDGSKQGGM